MTANPKGIPVSDPNQRLMNWRTKTDTGKVTAILDARGLDSAVLVRIRTETFNVVAPAP